MIAIIDYGMGNLRSVEKGFAKVGVMARVVNSAKDVRNAHGVVLPGVGAFRDCIKNLDDLGLREVILSSINQGKPFLGICLGLQVLFSESEEFGRCQGFNVFPGKVLRFPESKELKVPHMGWNTLNMRKRPPIFDGVPEEASFYFVHSYYVSPADSSIIAATTGYGLEFTSMIWKDNIFATQFHPEKSQSMGLRILKSFGDFVKRN